MTVLEMAEKIRGIARDLDGSVYERYSGRWMSGKKCLSIAHKDQYSVIEAAARAGLPRPRLDNLGKWFVFYWPEVPSAS